MICPGFTPFLSLYPLSIMKFIKKTDCDTWCKIALVAALNKAYMCFSALNFLCGYPTFF